MLNLFVATSNPGKLRDFAAVAETSDVSLQPLPALKEIPAPAEDEPAFEGNSRAKALYYSGFAPGEIVLADDSGLEVDALGGEPGVRSARYAADAHFSAPDEPDADRLNNLYLLDRLKDAPPGRRQARYRCVLAAARDGKCLFIADGTVEGEILTAPRGDGGFGYDPLFFLPEIERTMAELDFTARLRISHRGKALRHLLKQMLATPDNSS
jgi:XTP/dITP diphosphohydrolase